MGGVRKRLSAEVEEVGFDGPDSIAIYLDGEEISRTCIVENPKAEARQLLATYQRVLEAGARAEREAVKRFCENLRADSPEDEIERGVEFGLGLVEGEIFSTHPRRGLSE